MNQKLRQNNFANVKNSEYTDSMSPRRSISHRKIRKTILRGMLVLGLSSLFSFGLILSGIGGIRQTTEIQNTNASILGVRDTNQKTNTSVCPENSPILGIEGSTGNKKISSTIESGTISHTCFASTTEAKIAGYK
jgi:hypothetical protein